MAYKVLFFQFLLAFTCYQTAFSQSIKYCQDVIIDQKGKPLCLNFLTEEQANKFSNYYQVDYDKDSKLIIQKINNKKQVEYSQAFDEQNRLKTKIIFDSSGKITSHIEYIYDNQNLLVYWQNRDTNKKLLYFAKNYYDDQQRLIKSDLYDSQEKILQSTQYRYSKEGQLLTPLITVVDKEYKGLDTGQSDAKRVPYISPKLAPPDKQDNKTSNDTSNKKLDPVRLTDPFSKSFLDKEKKVLQFEESFPTEITKAAQIQYFEKLVFDHFSAKAPVFQNPLPEGELKGKSYYKVYFDSLSKLIAIYRFTDQGEKAREITYYYDAKNQLTKIVHSDAKVGIYLAQQFKYGKDGKLILTLVKTQKMAILFKLNYDKNSGEIVNAKKGNLAEGNEKLEFTLKEHFIYKNNKVVQKDTFNSKNYKKISYYYEDNKIVKEDYFSKETGNLLFYKTIQYQNGKPIETKYDGNGNPIK